MAATLPASSSFTTRLITPLINSILAIRPLAALLKNRARAMMIDRAESLGVSWRQTVKELRSRGESLDFSPQWDDELGAIANPDLSYPSYYTTSFHAYNEGNLGWNPAMEVEVAAQAVHARIWPEKGKAGDLALRQSYHDVLKARISENLGAIADLGCGVGLSSFTLQSAFPGAAMTGVDLSPYFLAVAAYRDRHRVHTPSSPAATWVHAPAEETGLPADSFDLVSACLMFHELPQSAAIAILKEARRLVRPGGYVAIMDMNPGSEVFAKMPPFVFTLLKSTEPYLDEYLSLDLAATMQQAGFERPFVTENSPRHRTLIAKG
ncbi:MAG: class I SAM-dependent methyltransferase [Elainellaceae cyanobacterium]